MQSETARNRLQVPSPALYLKDLPGDTSNAEAEARAVSPFAADAHGSELAHPHRSAHDAALEAAGLDAAAIEMRLQELQARRELEELFASGELPPLGG
jgi:hypothetical protein